MWTAVIRRTIQQAAAAKNREAKNDPDSMVISGPMHGGKTRSGSKSGRSRSITGLRESIIKTAKPMRLPNGDLVPGQQVTFDSSDEEDGDALIANQHEHSFQDLAIAQESAKRKFLSGVLTSAEYVDITNRHTSLIKSNRSNSNTPPPKSSTALWQSILPSGSNINNRNPRGNDGDNVATTMFGGNKKSSFNFNPWGSAAPQSVASPAPPSEENDGEDSSISDAMATVQASARAKLEKGIISSEE